MRKWTFKESWKEIKSSLRVLRRGESGDWECKDPQNSIKKPIKELLFSLSRNSNWIIWEVQIEPLLKNRLLILWGVNLGVHTKKGLIEKCTLFQGKHGKMLTKKVEKEVQECVKWDRQELLHSKDPRDVKPLMNAKIAKINLLGAFLGNLAPAIIEDSTLEELL